MDSSRPRVVFFAKVSDRSVLSRNEFYAVDLQILRDLGYDTTIATHPLVIPSGDLYFVWWWTWAMFPLLRARLAGRPVVIVGVFDHVLSNGALERLGARPRLHQELIKLALREADANVFSSIDQVEYCTRHFAVKRPCYSPMVIDTDSYRQGSVPREGFMLSVCWMHKGNSERKCIPELIEAMACLHTCYPHLRLVICGEKGSDYPRLARLVQRLGAAEYVEFPGVVTRQRKIDLMQRCMIYAQPTHAEGFGVAILEAMACGAPVVTSMVGAVPEVVGDTAVGVHGGDPDSIVSGIARLLDDAGARLELGRRARDRAASLFSYARRRADLQAVIGDVTLGRH